MGLDYVGVSRGDAWCDDTDRWLGAKFAPTIELRVAV